MYKDELYISLEEDGEPADGSGSRAGPEQSSVDQIGLDRTGPVQYQLVGGKTNWTCWGFFFVLFFFSDVFTLKDSLTFDLLETLFTHWPHARRSFSARPLPLLLRWGELWEGGPSVGSPQRHKATQHLFHCFCVLFFFFFFLQFLAVVSLVV